MRDRRIDISLLVLRFALGVVFILHGGQKVLGWMGGPGLEGFATHMPGGLPKVVGYLIAFGEFLGGMGVLVGLLTRIAAFGPAIAMAGAIVFVHGKNGFFMQDKGFEYPFALLAMAIAIMLTGPGLYSLDALLHRGREFRLPSASPLPA